MLPVSRSTLQRLLSQGQIQSFKVGRRRLIPVWALEEFCSRQEDAFFDEWLEKDPKHSSDGGHQVEPAEAQHG